jgi:hypothetical protein
MELSGQRHAPVALHQEKSLLNSLYRRLGGASEPVWTRGRIILKWIIKIGLEWMDLILVAQKIAEWYAQVKMELSKTYTVWF